MVWSPVRFQFLSYVIPVVYITAVYGCVWITTPKTFYDRAFLVGEKTAFGWSALPDSIALMLYVLLVGTIGMLPSCATALGEEIGWRGFLVPELAKAVGSVALPVVPGCGLRDDAEDARDRVLYDHHRRTEFPVRVDATDERQHMVNDAAPRQSQPVP